MPLDLQPIDLLLLVVLALAALSGWRRGFAMVLLGYLGLLIGLALGAWAATRVGLLVADGSSSRRLLVAVVVFFLVAAACHAIGNLVGMRLRSVVAGRWTGRVAAVAVWFIALTLSNVPFSPFARAVNESGVLRTFDRYAPRPPAALAQLRGLLARSPFPEAFANLRPPVVSGAPPRAANTAGVRRASAATVQIQSRGCGGLLFGSGFPVARDLVVTNAHVVAGAGSHRVITRDGTGVGARVVYFDPDHDLALLSAPGRPAGDRRRQGGAADPAAGARHLLRGGRPS